VLGDCEHALSDLATSANTVFQHPRWVALITLLRAVGHVLEKVDGPAASTEIKKRIDAAWQQLKADQKRPHIFYDFIEAERNDTIKQYEIGSAVNVIIKMPSADWMPASSDPRGGTTTTTYQWFMRDGPYQGRDPRELAREAIDFWKAYLDKINSI
jgi:hypothetical protein